jgi:alkylation response protein AidB-like acyl-CoA dehydrogenase
MDFAPTDNQRDIGELARKLFAAQCTPAVLKAVEATPERFHRKLWTDLAQAGLLGAALPEDLGGSGNGFLELCTLLQEAGAAVAPIPLWATLVTGAAPIAHFGTDAQKKRLLPGVAAGTTILTAALTEPGETDATRLHTVAKSAGGGAWALSGQKVFVPWVALAERVLVPAKLDGGDTGLFLVDPRAAGVTLLAHVSTTGETLHTLTLDGVRVGHDDVLAGDKGRAALEWILERALVGLCALELGIAERALAMTAAYTTQRQQFDRPIATCHAVSQRAADAYVDVETVKLATWNAAWRLANGEPAAREVAIAKYWAAEAGHRVVYAAQHLHGGMGYDLDYPLYRYYLNSRQIELTLGGATAQLVKLGADLAREEQA